MAISLDMKQVSIQDLKAQLSGVVAEAEAGEAVVITSHNKPVARIDPIGTRHVHPATEKRDRLRPALKRATRGRYLKALLDDRGDR